MKVEFAITVDSMDAFVRATYDLEGDSPLSLTAYECPSMHTINIIAANYFPKVTTVIAVLANGDSSREQQLTIHSIACIQLAYEYFNKIFDVDLASTMESFKAASFFSPVKVHELQSTVTDLISSLPFLGVKEVASLKSELPIYLAAVESISSSITRMVV